MHGYVFQYGNEKIDIGNKGTKLETESYGFALYQTTLDENDSFVDGIIGFNLLNIDHKRVIYGNTLKGDRDGEQFYGSINLGKRLHDDKINLKSQSIDINGTVSTKLFSEKTVEIIGKGIMNVYGGLVDFADRTTKGKPSKFPSINEERNAS